MTDINVVNSDGQVGSLPEEEAQRALASGAVRPATGEEIAGAKAAQDAQAAQKKYGGVVGVHAAHAVGMSRGLAESVGIPLDKVALDTAGFLGGPEWESGLRGHLKGLQEANPTISKIAEYTGAIVPSLVGNEGGLVARAGSLAEKGAARAAGVGATSLAGKIAQSAAPLAARGAAEGAMFGAVDSINESAIEDHELTAEQLLAGASGGALGGALFGGTIGAAGPIVGAAKSSIANAMGGLGTVFKRGERESGGVISKLHDAYVKASAATTGADENAIRMLTSLTPEGAAARRVAVHDGDKLISDAARAVRQHGDELLRADRLVADEARGELKAEYVRKAVARGNEAETAAHAEKQLQALVDGAEERLTNPSGVGFAKSVESVSKSAYRASEEIAAAIKSGEDVNAKIFVALDGVKRDVQKLAKNGARGIMNVADPLERRLAQESADWFRTAAEDLRVGLEREELWGRAATDQREINTAWSKQIEASGRFHNALTTPIGRDPLNPYLEARGIDPGKAEGYVRGLNNANKDLTHQAVRDYLQSTQDLANAISRSYELPAEKIAEVAKIHGAADALRGEISKSERNLEIVNAYRGLRESERGGAFSSLTGLVGGGAMGGPIGSAIGGIAGAVASPGRVASQLAAIEQIGRSKIASLLAIEKRSAQVSSKIDGALKGFFEGAKKSTPAQLSRPLTQLVESKPGEPKTKRFERLVARVSDLADRPEIQSERIAESSGDLHEHAPSIAMQVAGAQQRAIAFLASKIPPGMTDKDSLTPHLDRPSWTDSQMTSFERYVSAADSPISVLDDLESGRLTKEGAETLKTLYPRLFQEVQRRAMGHLADSKKKMPYQARLQLGLLLGIPSDASLDPAFVSVAQAGYEAPGGRPQGAPPRNGGGMSSLAKSTRSAMSEVEAS
ncbi:MAG: hypothetical protein JOZ84_02785 [Methylobacteriaceae bacterium]|nr:hypothetical protein [Solirubrobacterales bacterium]MBV9393315.1 hypothetical protein [Methylobacteriaceae bacterium]